MPRVEVFRQGDVYLKRVTDIPSDAKEVKNKIVQYGEVTGHHHKFAQSASCQVLAASDQKYVNVEQDSVLEHDEHDNMTIPEGKYSVFIQRELDIVQQERQVMD